MPSELRLQEAIDTLHSYSLVTRTTQNSSFYIHPVVHRWSRERQTEIQQSRRSAVILRGLGRLFPEIILPPTQENCVKVLRHAKFYVENCFPSLRVEDVKEEDFDALEKINHSTSSEQNNQISGTICLKSLDLSRSFPGLPKEKLDSFWVVIYVCLKHSGWDSMATFISEATFGQRTSSNKTGAFFQECLDAYSNALNHHLDSRSIDALNCCYKAIHGFRSLLPSYPSIIWSLTQSNLLLSIIEASQNNGMQPLQHYVERAKAFVRATDLPASVCFATDYSHRVVTTVCCAIACEEYQDYETAEIIYKTAVESMWRVAEGGRLLLDNCIVMFAIFLLNRKRYQECETHLRTRLAIFDPDNTAPPSHGFLQALYMLALVTFQQREFIKSASFFQRILEVEENWSALMIRVFLHSRFCLCLCLAAVGQKEEAFAVAMKGIRHCIRTNTDNPSRDNYKTFASFIYVCYVLKQSDSYEQIRITEYITQRSHEFIQKWKKMHFSVFFSIPPTISNIF